MTFEYLYEPKPKDTVDRRQLIERMGREGWGFSQVVEDGQCLMFIRTSVTIRSMALAAHCEVWLSDNDADREDVGDSCPKTAHFLQSIKDLPISNE